jgi:outer membrane protein assembly factor BamB
LVDKVLPAGVAAVAVAVLVWWFNTAEGYDLQKRLPREGVERQEEASPPEPIAKTHTVEGFGELEEPLPGLWPRFRGPNADGIARPQPDLARSWGPDGPPVLWTKDLGAGHAGAAVRDGRVYVLDYDETARRDALRCFSLRDGRELWRFSYPVVVRRQYGMSRTVPAVTDKYVVTFGPKCHVACVDAKTGAFRWAVDLVAEYGASVPPWRAGQCPLIDGGRAIVAVGGDVLMMGIDCETGEVAWKTPNPKDWQMTHSSVVPMTAAGRRMYLYAASGGIVGVSGDEKDAGTLLWEDPRWRVPFANVPCPVPLSGDRVFLAGGYGAGTKLFQLRPKEDRFEADVVFALDQKIFGAEQHTPLAYRGFIYGVSVGGDLVCLDLSGSRVWSSGRTKFGRGPYLIANGLIFAMNDTGELALAEATPSGYRELAQAKVLAAGERESWGPMAMAAGRLLVRDLTTMKCLDVRRK